MSGFLEIFVGITLSFWIYFLIPTQNKIYLETILILRKFNFWSVWRFFLLILRKNKIYFEKIQFLENS